MNNRDLKAKLMTGVADLWIWMKTHKLQTGLIVGVIVGAVIVAVMLR